MIVRLTNGPLARMLHFALHERLVAFCEKYTPEFPAEAIVGGWLERLYKDDPTLYLLVDLEENYTIKGHAVIGIEHHYGEPIIHCYQGQGERSTVIGVGVFGEWVDKIAAQVGATKAGFFVEKSSKALTKLGYHVARVYMLKTYGGDDEPE